MARYHINPETGNPNVCAAKVKCKLTSESGVAPPHYETQSEAKKAAEAKTKKTGQTKPKAPANTSDKTKTQAKKQSEKPVAVKAETKLFEAPVTSPVEAPVSVLPEVKTLEKVAPADEELRGPESLERAIKIARKLSISTAKRKQDVLVNFKKFQKNIPSRLRSIRSKVTKRS
jgi:hypothetical protein